MAYRNIFAAAAAAALMAASAQAENNDTVSATNPDGASVEAGIMTCELTGGTNFVVISEAKYTCVFDVAGDEFADEIYTAEIGKLGIDLSIEQAETIKWAVLAGTARFDPGLIAGEYIGASADAALGLGAGARVQVGGVDDSFMLQPLSVSGREGLGIAIGIEQMTLEYQGTAS
jgi:uncharacterized protein DUF992